MRPALTALMIDGASDLTFAQSERSVGADAALGWHSTQLPTISGRMCF